MPWDNRLLIKICVSSFIWKNKFPVIEMLLLVVQYLHVAVMQLVLWYSATLTKIAEFIAFLPLECLPFATMINLLVLGYFLFSVSKTKYLLLMSSPKYLYVIQIHLCFTSLSISTSYRFIFDLHPWCLSKSQHCSSGVCFPGCLKCNRCLNFYMFFMQSPTILEVEQCSNIKSNPSYDMVIVSILASA